MSAYDLDNLQSQADDDGNIKVRETLTFNDVLLTPQYSEIKSRSQVDISSQLDDNITLKIPIISSPMDTITEQGMAAAMANHGGLGVIHRYNTIEQQGRIVTEALVATKGEAPIAAAIGVSGDYLERAQELVARGARVLCVDIAHGHHILMKEALIKLREEFNGVHIMAGNVATLGGFNDLADWGAHSIRCGIGGGSICSTRIQTGHGVPGLTTVLDCARSTRKAKIIVDGGIKNSGDIVKALAAGADFVMLGSLLSGTDESPGEVLTYTDGSKRKEYRGMASRKAQESWRGKSGAPEGIATTVHYKGPVAQIMTDLTGRINSGLSYTGAKNLTELRTKAQFIRQTPAGQFESSTHILVTRK